MLIVINCVHHTCFCRKKKNEWKGGVDCWFIMGLLRLKVNVRVVNVFCNSGSYTSKSILEQQQTTVGQCPRTPPTYSKAEIFKKKGQKRISDCWKWENTSLSPYEHLQWATMLILIPDRAVVWMGGCANGRAVVLMGGRWAGGREARQAPLTLSSPQFFTDHFQTYQGHLWPYDMVQM